jgi:hypothetical protein
VKPFNAEQRRKMWIAVVRGLRWAPPPAAGHPGGSTDLTIVDPDGLVEALRLYSPSIAVVRD